LLKYGKTGVGKIKGFWGYATVTKYYWLNNFYHPSPSSFSVVAAGFTPTRGLHSPTGGFLSLTHAVQLITNRKSYGFLIETKVDDLERPWTVKTHMQSSVTTKVILQAQRSAHFSSIRYALYSEWANTMSVFEHAI